MYSENFADKSIPRTSQVSSAFPSSVNGWLWRIGRQIRPFTSQSPTCRIQQKSAFLPLTSTRMGMAQMRKCGEMKITSMRSTFRVIRRNCKNDQNFVYFPLLGFYNIVFVGWLFHNRTLWYGCWSNRSRIWYGSKDTFSIGLDSITPMWRFPEEASRVWRWTAREHSAASGPAYVRWTRNLLVPPANVSPDKLAITVSMASCVIHLPNHRLIRVSTEHLASKFVLKNLLEINTIQASFAWLL